MKTIKPKEFGLSSRVNLEWIEESHLAIIIQRKSRIIMKDGQRILERIKTIKKVDDKLKVSLKAAGPICSKTVKLLNDNNINIIQ